MPGRGGQLRVDAREREAGAESAPVFTVDHDRCRDVPNHRARVLAIGLSKDGLCVRGHGQTDGIIKDTLGAVSSEIVRVVARERLCKRRVVGGNIAVDVLGHGICHVPVS